MQNNVVYEKLQKLATRIESAIRRLSKDAGISGTLSSLKDRAYCERAPEAEHATLLFEEYSETVESSMKADATQSSMLPSYLVEGTSETLVGVEATKSNIFIMRSIVLLLSFIAFIVLVSNSLLSYATLTSDDMLDRDNANCAVVRTHMSGSFSMGVYQMLAAMAFFLMLHSLICVVYYYLPIGTDNRKYVPGFKKTLDQCLNGINHNDMTSNTNSMCESLSLCIHNNAKLIELIVDVVLFFFTLLFLIICSIDVDRGAEFKYDNNEIYFTIGTFYLTFHDCYTSPDPATFIRGGSAMLYLAMFVAAFALKVSYDSYKKHRAMYDGGIDEDGLAREQPLGHGSAHDGRSLIRNDEESDNRDHVEITL